MEKNGVASKNVIGLRKLKSRKGVIRELSNELFMFVIKGDFDVFEGFVEYFGSEEDFIEFVIIGRRVKFHVI